MEELEAKISDLQSEPASAANQQALARLTRSLAEEHYAVWEREPRKDAIEHACQAFSQALAFETNQADVEFWIRCAELYISYGSHKEAIGLIRAALLDFPNHQQLMFTGAAAARSAGNFSIAEEYLLNLIRSPTQFSVYTADQLTLQLGWTYEMQGNWFMAKGDKEVASKKHQLAEDAYRSAYQQRFDVPTSTLWKPESLLGYRHSHEEMIKLGQIHAEQRDWMYAAKCFAEAVRLRRVNQIMERTDWFAERELWMFATECAVRAGDEAAGDVLGSAVLKTMRELRGATNRERIILRESGPLARKKVEGWAAGDLSIIMRAYLARIRRRLAHRRIVKAWRRYRMVMRVFRRPTARRAIQHWWHTNTDRRMALKVYRAARRIQGLFRATRARAEMRELRVQRVHRAGMTVYTAMLMLPRRCTFLAWRRAAIKIQAQARVLNARVYVQELREYYDRIERRVQTHTWRNIGSVPIQSDHLRRYVPPQYMKLPHSVRTKLTTPAEKGWPPHRGEKRIRRPKEWRIDPTHPELREALKSEGAWYRATAFGGRLENRKNLRSSKGGTLDGSGAGKRKKKSPNRPKSAGMLQRVQRELDRASQTYSRVKGQRVPGPGAWGLQAQYRAQQGPEAWDQPLQRYSANGRAAAVFDATGEYVGVTDAWSDDDVDWMEAWMDKSAQGVHDDDQPTLAGHNTSVVSFALDSYKDDTASAAGFRSLGESSAIGGTIGPKSGAASRRRRRRVQKQRGPVDPTSMYVRPGSKRALQLEGTLSAQVAYILDSESDDELDVNQAFDSGGSSDTDGMGDLEKEEEFGDDSPRTPPPVGSSLIDPAEVRLAELAAKRGQKQMTAEQKQFIQARREERARNYEPPIRSPVALAKHSLIMDTPKYADLPAGAKTLSGAVGLTSTGPPPMGSPMHKYRYNTGSAEEANSVREGDEDTDSGSEFSDESTYNLDATGATGVHIFGLRASVTHQLQQSGMKESPFVSTDTLAGSSTSTRRSSRNAARSRTPLLPSFAPAGLQEVDTSEPSGLGEGESKGQEELPVLDSPYRREIERARQQRAENRHREDLCRQPNPALVAAVPRKQRRYACWQFVSRLRGLLLEMLEWHRSEAMVWRDLTWRRLQAFIVSAEEPDMKEAASVDITWRLRRLFRAVRKYEEPADHVAAMMKRYIKAWEKIWTGDFSGDERLVAATPVAPPQATTSNEYDDTLDGADRGENGDDYMRMTNGEPVLAADAAAAGQPKSSSTKLAGMGAGLQWLKDERTGRQQRTKLEKENAERVRRKRLPKPLPASPILASDGATPFGRVEDSMAETSKALIHGDAGLYKTKRSAFPGQFGDVSSGAGGGMATGAADSTAPSLPPRKPARGFVQERNHDLEPPLPKPILGVAEPTSSLAKRDKSHWATQPNPQAPTPHDIAAVKHESANTAQLRAYYHRLLLNAVKLKNWQDGADVLHQLVAEPGMLPTFSTLTALLGMLGEMQVSTSAHLEGVKAKIKQKARAQAKHGGGAPASSKPKHRRGAGGAEDELERTPAGGLLGKVLDKGPDDRCSGIVVRPAGPPSDYLHLQGEMGRRNQVRDKGLGTTYNKMADNPKAHARLVEEEKRLAEESARLQAAQGFIEGSMNSSMSSLQFGGSQNSSWDPTRTLVSANDSAQLQALYADPTMYTQSGTMQATQLLETMRNNRSVLGPVRSHGGLHAYDKDLSTGAQRPIAWQGGDTTLLQQSQSGALAWSRTFKSAGGQSVGGMGDGGPNVKGVPKRPKRGQRTLNHSKSLPGSARGHANRLLETISPSVGPSGLQREMAFGSRHRSLDAATYVWYTSGGTLDYEALLSATRSLAGGLDLSAYDTAQGNAARDGGLPAPVGRVLGSVKAVGRVAEGPDALTRRVHERCVRGPADLAICAMRWCLILGHGNRTELYIQAFAVVNKSGAWWHAAILCKMIHQADLEITPALSKGMISAAASFPKRDRHLLYQALQLYGTPYKLAKDMACAGLESLLEQQAALYGLNTAAAAQLPE